MSKFICATYEPDKHYYKIPKEWDLKDIRIVWGTVYYKNVEQDLKCWEMEDDEKYPQAITRVYKNNILYVELERYFDCESE